MQSRRQKHVDRLPFHVRQLYASIQGARDHREKQELKRQAWEARKDHFAKCHIARHAANLKKGKVRTKSKQLFDVRGVSIETGGPVVGVGLAGGGPRPRGHFNPRDPFVVGEE